MEVGANQPIIGAEKARQMSHIATAIETTPNKTTPTTDSGISSIEKSTKIPLEAIWAMSFPILVPPIVTENHLANIAVVSLDQVIKSANHDIIQKMLDGWEKTNRKIEELSRAELVLQLQRKQMQELKTTTASGIDTIAIMQVLNITPYSTPISADYYVKRESATSKIDARTHSQHQLRYPQTSSNELVMVLGAAMLAGAAFAISPMSNLPNTVSSPDITVKLVECIQNLNMWIPPMQVQDVIPIINLLITGPIYYHSWNDAINNFEVQQRNHTQMAQNFARDILTIVQDPLFTLTIIRARIPRVDQLSADDLKRLVAIIHVFLIGSAIGLCYSVEVGKIQNNQFGGLEPEELRDIIIGKLTMNKFIDPQLSVSDDLMKTLIKHIAIELNNMSYSDKLEVAHRLIEYLAQPRELNPMLNPIKVFDEVLLSGVFHKSIAKTIKG